MFGTIMHAVVRPDNRDALMHAMAEGTDVPGFRGTHVMFPDDGEDQVVAAIFFDDRESYSANAHDPATEEWYGRFRALLEEDPRWTDGEWISFLPADPVSPS